MDKNNSTSIEVIHFSEWTPTGVSSNTKTSLEVGIKNDNDGNIEQEITHSHCY